MVEEITVKQKNPPLFHRQGKFLQSKEMSKMKLNYKFECLSARVAYSEGQVFAYFLDSIILC